MSLGTLYANNRARALLSKSLVNHFGLDIKVVEDQADATLAANFPLKKVPSFIGADGFKLHESIAVNLYLVSLAGDAGKALLGETKEDYFTVLKWLSYVNTEVFPPLIECFAPLIGAKPYNKKLVEEQTKLLETKLEVLEQVLLKQSYLVNERPTLADYYLATMLFRGFESVFGAEWRTAHPAISRSYATLTQHELLAWFFEDKQFIDEPKKFVAPKKEEKPKAEKKEKPAKAAPAAAAPVEEEPPKEKKVAHPLAALGNPEKLVLDEWKRTYSNEDTRPTAINWFWNHYDASEYSLWRIDYKYNDELTLTFMSNNLIGGFFNRLSASTKYLFGTAVVYGENNNNGIVGAFLVRGDDHVPAFDVAPDWESYSFTKLNPSSEEDKKFFNNMLAWDEPVAIEGKEREIADGKVFK